MTERTLELVVRGAEKRDAGRGIARLPETARRELGLLSGDTLVIEGPRATVTKMWPARADVPDGTIQIDGDTRANAGVRIGETVRVASVDVDDAVAVTLDAPESVTRADIDPEVVAEAVRRDLRDRPLRGGDRVRVERLADEPFVVAGTRPDGTVRVTGETRVTVDVDGEATVRASAGGGTDAGADAGRARDRDRDGDRSAGGRGRGADGDAGAGAGSGSGSGDGRPASTAEGDEGTMDEPRTDVTYEDIGGLDEELDLVREMIELPLSEPEVFAHLGVDPPAGVLLHGPPGTGKTLIAKAVANEVDATFVSVSGPEIMSKYKGESEEKLRETFAEARENAPAIIFFDEIDSIAGKRDDGGDTENRIVGQLLSLMDGLDARGDVIVIGATNRADSLDPALRRGGRFDREIEIGVPNERGRREIIEVHTRGMPLADDVDLDRLASTTHGFVGADLESLAKEAAMVALRRSRRGDGDGRERVPLAELTVSRADFDAAMAGVEPSAMREYVAEQPTEGFESVGGLDDVKETLRRAVSWPLEYAPLFQAADTDPPSGVLLHGPPGTGKTLLARAIAAESGVNFIHVAGPELLDRYVGESEKSVREVFDRARQAAPAIVMFDEIDAIASDRDSQSGDSGVTDRVVSQLLTEMDNAADNPNLMVLAATNRRYSLDPALLRPGRLEQHVEVPAPDEAARRAIFAVHTRGKPLADEVDLDALAATTQGYSGADIAAVCREAAVLAIREVAERYEGAEANEHADEISVTSEQFDAALATVEPSL